MAAAALAIAAVVAAALAVAQLVPVASASAATHTTGGQRKLKDRILRSASMAAGAAGADGGGGVELPARISPSPGTDRCTTMIVGPKVLKVEKEIESDGDDENGGMIGCCCV